MKHSINAKQNREIRSSNNDNFQSKYVDSYRFRPRLGLYHQFHLNGFVCRFLMSFAHINRDKLYRSTCY